ncbi:MAG: ArsR/SmtB family transcription factor [Coriobacteriales bacterium]|jgi:DNA-binding transcriptional ArsR family regulator
MSENEECLNTRKLLYNEFRENLRVFTALGDETRQKIFLALLECGDTGLRVPQITEMTHLSRPAVSHHLKLLRDAGLISMHRQGTMNFYYIDPRKGCWPEMQKLFEHVGECMDRLKKAQTKLPKLGSSEME